MKKTDNIILIEHRLREMYSFGRQVVFMEKEIKT
jgi:energy-coupling factor transporter ATP-binding protein EcfA2